MYAPQHHRHHTDNRHPNPTNQYTANNNIYKISFLIDILYSLRRLFLSNTICSMCLNTDIFPHQQSRHNLMCYPRNMAIFHQTTLSRDRYIPHARNDPMFYIYCPYPICFPYNSEHNDIFAAHTVSLFLLLCIHLPKSCSMTSHSIHHILFLFLKNYRP